MLYQTLISVPIILMILFGSFFLGKYISETYEMFNNNPFASLVIGIIAYLGLNFISFFILLWLKPSIIYFVIVFFVKEFLLYSFLIIRRDKYITSINWNSLIWILISGLIILFVYNFGIIEYTKDVDGTQAIDFNSWFVFDNVISKFSGIENSFADKWILGYISATTIYAIISSYFTEIYRRQDNWNYFLALLISLLIISLMGLGIGMADSIGFFILSFMVLISIRMIFFMRRRYAGLFGITTFVVYSIHSESLLAIGVLALLTTIVYTYLRKPKASLFWVQLISPILMILALQFYADSKIIAIVIFILSTTLYVLMLSAKSVKLLSNINKFVDRWRVVIPVIMFSSIWIAAITIIVTTNVDIGWLKMHSTQSVIYRNIEKSLISTIIQIISYIFLIAFLIHKIIDSVKNNTPINPGSIIIAFSAITILFIYNPIINRMLIATGMQDYFPSLFFITIIPLVILGSFKAKEKIHATILKLQL